ncbi:MAG: sulfotransferase [Planctomycetota bacterium]
MVAPILLIHRIAWWLDTLLFGSFENAAVRKPLFIVGVPRSGTTLAHRLVASQKSVFTTFPLWELLLAPALCEKYVFAGVARADRMIGGVGAACVRWLQGRVAKSIADVHPTTLDSPEEDYLGLLPFGGCFIKILAFPHDERVWKLVAANDVDRKRYVRLYRGLLARHLRFRGEHLTVVSKNPSFCNWIDALAEEFPDARFIALRRKLSESLPSQLSSMRDGFALFGHDIADPELVTRFASMYQSYWANLEANAASRPPNQFRLVEYRDLRERCWDSVHRVLDDFGYRSSEEERQELKTLCEQAQGYVSRHHYDPSEFGLTPEQLRPVVSEQSDDGFDSSMTPAVELAEMTQPSLTPRSLPCAQR